MKKTGLVTIKRIGDTLSSPICCYTEYVNDGKLSYVPSGEFYTHPDVSKFNGFLNKIKEYNKTVWGEKLSPQFNLWFIVALLVTIIVSSGISFLFQYTSCETTINKFTFGVIGVLCAYIFIKILIFVIKVLCLTT